MIQNLPCSRFGAQKDTVSINSISTNGTPQQPLSLVPSRRFSRKIAVFLSGKKDWLTLMEEGERFSPWNSAGSPEDVVWHAKRRRPPDPATGSVANTAVSTSHDQSNKLLVRFASRDDWFVYRQKSALSSRTWSSSSTDSSSSSADPTPLQCCLLFFLNFLSGKDMVAEVETHSKEWYWVWRKCHHKKSVWKVGNLICASPRGTRLRKKYCQCPICGESSWADLEKKHKRRISETSMGEPILDSRAKWPSARAKF